LLWDKVYGDRNGYYVDSDAPITMIIFHQGVVKLKGQGTRHHGYQSLASFVDYTNINIRVQREKQQIFRGMQNILFLYK
jgi:hypothetical protein